MIGTLVITKPNQDQLFGSVEVAAQEAKLGFMVELVASVACFG